MRKVTLFAAVALVALAGAGCNKLKSRDNLNKGVQAFRNAQYPEAVEKFKIAVELDPTYATARLYLATAYMQQYIPGAESPENKQMWDAAFQNFSKVIEQDPKNTVGLASIASLYLNIKDWTNARRWYEKLIAVEPSNKDAYYSLGFIAWSEWYPDFGKARAELGMKTEDPGPLKDKKIREELRTKYSGLIEEGMKNLKKCLEIDPEYEDAMSYMNLLTRERADLSETKEDYEAQIKVADEWMSKALATIKAKAEKKAKKGSSGGITAPQE